MRKTMAKLLRIDNNRNIEDTEDPFFYLIQHALLLSLYERGVLTFMQLRHAEARLAYNAQRNKEFHYSV